MTIRSIWLRRIHKWVGLIIGAQFLLWAISGTAMALLDKDEVEGGPRAEVPARIPVADPGAWPRVQAALAGQTITGLAIRHLPQGPVYEVTTAAGVRLFSATDGAVVPVDRARAIAIARAAHPAHAAVAAARPLDALTLAVRDHRLPIWQVDFEDGRKSSYYVSGTTGALLERRNRSWRWWDFFWMLHNMDYSRRTSFNHPLIVTVAFAMAWLSLTGFWLLFRTMWRHDVAWLGARTRRAVAIAGKARLADPVD